MKKKSQIIIFAPEKNIFGIKGALAPLGLVISSVKTFGISFDFGFTLAACQVPGLFLFLSSVIYHHIKLYCLTP